MEPRAEDDHLEGDGAEAANIDDDEVEELHNSLKEIVQDPSVKPKLQCLMVDPSFSMVTVQSEDSGIVWETASSRCSTPWASEASSPSDAYSMEGSGTQGNIIIIMDEEKIRRKKKTNSKGKLSDRFRRRFSGAAIGEERPAMVEVSVPNVRPEASEDGQSSESKADKDQDLFNLISDGFEILNIVVPSKLPTVDEEDSTELADNLSYLENTPNIKSKCKPPESTESITSPGDVDIDGQETKDESLKDLTKTLDEQCKKEEPNLDYLEKFTLLDENAPSDVSEKLEPIEVVQSEEPQVPQEKGKVDDKLDEDSFVIISDVEIAAEHLDEVFYGAKCHEEPVLPSHHEEHGKRLERQSSKTLKECGSTLFGSQESILIPVYLPSGPPKIIDQDLLDEPRAMSFHYSDLYEDAIGDRKKDEDFSDAESIVSEKSFKRRFSDSDDADGYLEKFILKDDTKVAEAVPKVDHTESDRTIWPQNKFEMTGCLIRVKEETQPEEEDGNASQSKLEGTHDVTESQIPHPPSGDCEDCGELKTGCATVKCALEERGDCGTKTGCEVPKMISQDQHCQKEAGVLKAVNQESDPSLLIDDGKQSKVEIKCERKQAPANVGKEKVTKVKDGLEILPTQQKHGKREITSSVSNENAFYDGLKETTKVTDSKVEIEETIIITKKELSGKGQQLKSKTQEKTEPILLTKALKETTATVEKQILPLEKVAQKDLPVVKKENKKIKPSSGRAVVPKHGFENEATATSLSNKSEVLEKKQAEEVDCKIQEQVSTVVEKVEARIRPESHEAKDAEVRRELETVQEQKASEELLTSGKDAAEKRKEEMVKVTEEIKVENESVEEVVQTVECEFPAVESETVEKSETVDTVSAVETLSDATQCVPSSEKHVLVDEPSKMAIDTDLKHELPSSGGDQILQKRTEIREGEGEEVLVVTLPQELAVELPTLPDDDFLSTAALPPVPDKIELSDAVLKDVHAEGDAEATLSLPALPEVSMSLPVPNEVHKQEESETRDPASVEITLQEPIDQLSKQVPVTVADEDTSEMPAPELEAKVEAKSKKVLLKDTHKENIWRTLEPTTPPPPVETQDSLTMRVSPLEPEYTRDDEDFIVEGQLKRDAGLLSTLRSFSPHEDLSGFGRDTTELGLNKEMAEELDYEMVTKQDARQLETEVTTGKEEIDYVQDQSTEQTVEAGYEIIEDLEGAKTSESKLLLEEAEIQPMDAFCLVCHCPILMSDGGHQNHEVSSLDKAFEDIRDRLGNLISVLQERSENIEDMVSELELAYNSVEEYCKDSEKAMDEQNEEMLKLVMDQYNEMSQSMEDEKKVKLEQLYDQIVSFQANIDSAKETMEKATKEMEEMDDLTFASSYKDIDTRLKTALDSTMSLELGPRGLLVFEDYAKGTTGNEKKNRQAIPVPQQPHLQPQEANSATNTSVTVYWTISEADIIDCFQVYCMEEPQGAVSEEYRVTVKESYCNLEDLEPDKCYKVWVMAVNYTGCSLPSERLPFRTAPSVPVIHPEACTVLWDSATIRWSSSQPSAVESFTLEYCRQYAMEGEGLRSVSGIKGYEHKVLLQPNENFLFYIKSVNAAGASEQSEAALISTRGTRFHLLSETANAVLKVSEDRNSVEYPLDTYNQMSSLIECPAVMGEVLPPVGYHYWETVVTGCKAYRIGVAYKTAPQNSTVGDNTASWCLHCVPTSISCRFELLHDTVESDIFVMDVPARIGTLLDFMQGRLVFFNTKNGQCLGSFKHHFSQLCHPVFVVEKPGSLELKMTMEVPEFAKHW